MVLNNDVDGITKLARACSVPVEEGEPLTIEPVRTDGVFPSTAAVGGDQQHLARRRRPLGAIVDAAHDADVIARR